MGTKHIILKIRHMRPQNLHFFFSFLFPFIIKVMAEIRSIIAKIKRKMNAYKTKIIFGAFSIHSIPFKIFQIKILLCRSHNMKQYTSNL